MKLKKIFKFAFIFFITYSINIEVKANSIYQVPSNCINSSMFECSLISGPRSAEFDLNKNEKIYFGINTHILNQKGGHWNFIKGALRWTTNDTQRTLKTIAGQFTIQKFSDVILIQNLEDSVTTIFVLSGEVFAEPLKPLNGSYKIPSGSTNWFGPIGSNQRNTEGIPAALTWELISKKLGSTYLPLASQEKKIIEKREPANIEMISNFYFDLSKTIGRLHDQRIANEEQILKNKQEEAARVRKLFRQKTQYQFIDDE